MMTSYREPGLRRFTVPSSRLGLLLTAAAALSGCFTELNVLEGPDGGAMSNGDRVKVIDGGDSSDPSVIAEQICVRGGVCGMIRSTEVNKLDVLFVVDDSHSMVEEQDALKAQLPKLVETLMTGRRTPDDPNPFVAIKDVHLGVVTTDMGLVGVTGIHGCESFGDDGVMRDPGSCGAGQPDQRFLSYTTLGSDPMTFASELGCLLDVGTGGCGFEQPLEAALKALWPKTDVDVMTGMVQNPNRVDFLKDANGLGGFGHGDVENRGFLRNNPQEGLSLLAIVIVTDEEDCSSANTHHLKPAAQLAPGDPNLTVDMNLRCFKNTHNLYEIGTRYLPALKALRPGNEHLIVFGAIVGVPPQLVDGAARAPVDFTNPMSRDAYYDAILDDQRMQYREDPSRTPGNGNLQPSCNTPTGMAYPPRRIVELAKGMGENSFVQSICQADFAPAMEPLIELMANRAHGCFPSTVQADADGVVLCNVIWEMPLPGTAPALTPLGCGGSRPFLHESARYPQVAGRGKRCVVDQRPESARAVSMGSPDGWYYDDFSGRMLEACEMGEARIAYTPGAEPPPGVIQVLDCEGGVRIN